MASGNGGEGLFAALRNVLATLVAIGRTRLQLLSTEVEEETIRLLGMVARGVAAMFLLGLGIILAVASAAAAFWEQRVAIFGLCALFALVGGAYLLLRVKRQISQPSALFRSSLAELDADLARLRGKVKDLP